MLAGRRALLRTLERERQAHQEERRLLIETICHLAGKPVAVTERDLHQAAERNGHRDDLDLVEADHLPDY